MAVKNLGVWLDGERIADLRAVRPGRITCHYTAQARERWPLNIPLLSCSLPLRRQAQDAWAFSTGLLPEGQHRQSMAALARIPTSDVMGLLARFGRDVAGALIISAEDPPLRDPSVEEYRGDELSTEIGSLDQHPLGLHDDSELSIAGLQDKILLVGMSDGRWGRPRNGYPSTHILKVDDRLHRGLVRAEHCCLQLAARSGLLAAESRLITIGDAECIVVKRFDRRVTDESVTRLHQEDACQALGINSEDNQRLAKYQAGGGPSLREIAGLLNTWSADPLEQQLSLLDLATFTVLIGNADAHGKNVALLHPTAETISLAPLYDTVPTMLWPRLRTEAAMPIAGQTDLSLVSIDDITAEARSWGIRLDTARRRALDVADKVHETLKASLVDADTPALDLIKRRTSALLAA